MVLIDDPLEVVRVAPKRAMAELPFSTWIASAKATLVDFASLDEGRPQFTVARQWRSIEASDGRRIQLPKEWRRILETSNPHNKYQPLVHSMNL